MDPQFAQIERKVKKAWYKQKKWLITLVILILVLAGSAVLFIKYNQLKRENARLSNPDQAAQAEVTRLTNEVGKLIELPNETPTLATVTDVSKLKGQGQAFFANAQNGDKVLIFTQAKKAILYRPSTHKIIEVAPITIGDSTTGSNSGTTTQSTTNPSTTTPKKP